MADTEKTPGVPATEPRVTHTGGDGSVSPAAQKVLDEAKKAQADEARDEGAGRAAVPVEEMTTANDK